MPEPVHAPPRAAAHPGGPGGGESGVSAWLTGLGFDWSPLVAGARRRRLAPDELLFLQGQAAQTVHVILSGRVRLTSFGFDGKERQLMILGPGGLAGDCALPAARQYAVSAVAATEAEVASVSSGRFQAALAADPALAEQQRALAALRFRVLLRHVAAQGPQAGRRQVGLHLLDLMHSYGEPHPRGTLIGITFTQQEMGSICGLSRVSVSQIVNAFAREGVIARAGRRVLVLDARRLAAIARH